MELNTHILSMGICIYEYKYTSDSPDMVQRASITTRFLDANDIPICPVTLLQKLMRKHAMSCYMLLHICNINWKLQLGVHFMKDVNL